MADVENGDNSSSSDDVLINDRLLRPSQWDNQPVKRHNATTFGLLEDLDQYNGSGDILLPDSFAWECHSDTKPLAKDLVINEVVPFLNTHSGADCLFHASHLPRRMWLVLVKGSSSNAIVGAAGAAKVTWHCRGAFVEGHTLLFVCTHVQARGKRLASMLLRQLLHKLPGKGTGLLMQSPEPLPFLPIVSGATLLERLFVPGVSKPKPTKDVRLIRHVTATDLVDALHLYNTFAQSFDVYSVLTLANFQAWCLPKNRSKISFVLTNKKGELIHLAVFQRLVSRSRGPMAMLECITTKQPEALAAFVRNLLFILRRSQYNGVMAWGVAGWEAVLTHAALGFRRTSRHLPTYAFNIDALQAEPSQSVLVPTLHWC